MAALILEDLAFREQPLLRLCRPLQFMQMFCKLSNAVRGAFSLDAQNSINTHFLSLRGTIAFSDDIFGAIR